MEYKFDLDNIFNHKKISKSIILIWLFMLIGLVLFAGMFIASDQTRKSSFIHFFLKNIGLIFLFISLLIGCSGVHRVNSLTPGSILSIKELFIRTGKKSHIVALITLCVLLFICAVTALQVGISMISHIPYAGPIIISLLTIPSLLLNVCCLVISLYIIILTPPMVAEDKDLRSIFNELVLILKNRGFYAISIILLSLALFFLILNLVLFLAEYSAGLTKAVQWKINIAYPVEIEKFIRQSYLTDVIKKIGIRPDNLETLKNYGFEAINYISLIKYMAGIFFAATFAFIFSFPFAVYFTFLSDFYNRIKTKSGTAQSDQAV